MVTGETTGLMLMEVLYMSPRRQYKPLPGFDPDMDEEEYNRLQQDIDCDEVYPNIFIGDALVFNFNHNY